VEDTVRERKSDYLETSFSGSDTASEEDEEVVIRTKAVELAPPKPVPTGSSILGGLNRAEMERERLERLKRAGGQQISAEPPSKRPRMENIDYNKSVPTKSVQSHTSIQYPDGTIKWTFARGFPVERHHITIEEVLQKGTLKAAVLSAFQVQSRNPQLIQDRISMDSRET
jgi:hypothetical protein